MSFSRRPAEYAGNGVSPQQVGYLVDILGDRFLHGSL